MSAPYIPFFAGDYMRDTQHLSTEQHGAYLLMLFTMWTNNGWLPNDDKKLARITRLSGAKWKNNKEDILAFFDIEQDIIRCNKLEFWEIQQKKIAPRPSIPLFLRLQILERDNFSCVYCGTKEGPFELDHVYPYSLGGSDTEDNLACSCQCCNRSKGAKTLEEWRAN